MKVKTLYTNPKKLVTCNYTAYSHDNLQTVNISNELINLSFVHVEHMTEW